MKEIDFKKIAPSIFAGNFANLEKEVKRCENAGVEYLHIDIMDGHFVPNISFGPKVVNDLRKISSLKFDTHLMITDPEKYIERFIDAGSEIVTFHYEAIQDPIKLLKFIRRHNVKAGLSIKPATSFECIQNILEYADLLLIMSVEPGFSGQKFIESVLIKIEKAAKYKLQSGLKYIIEVDGGVNYTNYKKLLNAGAELLVMGSGFFKG